MTDRTKAMDNLIAQDADLIEFMASDAACYLYPGEHQQAETLAGALEPFAVEWNTCVVSHSPTTNPVVDHETGNMIDKQRDAVPVVWSEPSPPNDESSYDHCIASFKFGTLKAEWKSWKDHPGYTVFFEGCNNFIGTYNTLADAKKAGETWVSTALEKDV